MSKPAANPFFEIDFSKFMDMSSMSKMMDMSNMTKMMDMSNMSKMMGDMKMPQMNLEPIMMLCRRNIEACTAVNQAAFEGMQSVMRRQAELARQSYEEVSSMMNTIMQCPTAEEKVLRQAEASKVAVDKCMANAREITDTIAKCNYQAMETLSHRMGESLEELRSIMKSGTQVAA